MHKNKSLVTVIVPAYNEEKHIEECLKSIKEQTYKNIELIVVDDGSTDKTKEIAKGYADVLLTQQHQGPGVARNKATKIAKGEILVFVDADIYLDKSFVKAMTLPIIMRKAISSFTRREYIANPENIWVKCYVIDNNLKSNKKNIESSNQENYFRAILKKEFLAMGGYDTSLGYNDDHFFSDSSRIKSFPVDNAICCHFSPDTLKDVFSSARWIGRSVQYSASFENILKYSPLNSIRISLRKIIKGAPLEFIFYKLTFDFAMLIGILNKNPKNNYAK